MLGFPESGCLHHVDDPCSGVGHTVTIAQSILLNQLLTVNAINISRSSRNMEDRYAETVPLPVSPRQDEIQGRPHGGSAVAPITPDIGSLGCDLDDIHGARAVDILEFRDHTTHLSNTPGHEDLVDTIHRLKAENKALRDAQD